MFTVCVLCYGDFTHLAKRCLESLVNAPASYLLDLRIGLNEVSESTQEFVREFCRARRPDAHIAVFTPPRNVGKGPIMRRMFYERPMQPYVMWFDDDSYLDPTCDQAWWEGVAGELHDYPAVLGCPHVIRLRGEQHQAIPTLPWYGGQPVPVNHTYRFITGGWWVADAGFLEKWNFPFPEIWHNGDDSILGELARQQDRCLKRSQFAKCHCESCLRNPSPDLRQVHVNVGGTKGRRGIALQGEVWPWQNYVPDQPPDYSHHHFDCRIECYC